MIDRVSIYYQLIISGMVLIFPFFVYFFCSIISYKVSMWQKEWLLFFTILISSTLFLEFGISIEFNIQILFGFLIIVLFFLVKNHLFHIFVILMTGITYFVSTHYWESFVIYSLIVSAYFFYAYKKDMKSSKKFIILFIFNLIFWTVNALVHNYNFTILFNAILVLLLQFGCATIILIVVEQAASISKGLINMDYVSVDNKVYNNLAKITHEIKNPIAVVKGYIELLENNPFKTDKYIPIIKSEISRALSLMEDFLSINKLVLNKEVIDVQLLAKEVIDTMYPMIFTNNIKIHMLIDDEIYIEGDFVRLKQVLINIVKNAIEAISAIRDFGNITFKVSIQGGSKVVLHIIDDGEGFTDEDIQNVGTGLYTRKEKGTGIGILLSMEIIRLHGGKIVYESKRNVGTIVNIYLPGFDFE